MACSTDTDSRLLAVKNVVFYKLQFIKKNQFFSSTSTSRKCMGVNGEALQLQGFSIDSHTFA